MDDLVDLSLEQILLKGRVAGSSHREEERAVLVEYQPSLDANDPWMHAASDSCVVVERGHI
eukprot:12708668-Heterocapsa_arctica.AAC.1